MQPEVEQINVRIKIIKTNLLLIMSCYHKTVKQQKQWPFQIPLEECGIRNKLFKSISTRPYSLY